MRSAADVVSAADHDLTRLRRPIGVAFTVICEGRPPLTARVTSRK